MTVSVDTRNAYFRSHRQGAEFKMAGLVATCRHWVIGSSGLWKSGSHIQVVFDSGVYQGISVARFCLAVKRLNSSSIPPCFPFPCAEAEPYLLALLTRIGDALLAGRSTSATPLRSRVERLVLEALPKGAPEADRIATPSASVNAPSGAN